MSRKNITKIPDTDFLCEKCKKQPVPPWLSSEMYGNDYETCRNDIIMVIKRDMCSKCGEELMKKFDEVNKYNLVGD